MLGAFTAIPEEPFLSLRVLMQIGFNRKAEKNRGPEHLSSRKQIIYLHP
jgi:hypothetical protein